MKYSALVFLALILSYVFNIADVRISYSGSSPQQRSTQAEFKKFLKIHPDQIFSPNISEKTQSSLKSYARRELLPNGSHYGDSVRNYSLENKTAKKIKTEMLAMGCAFKADVLREPEKNQPIVFQGHATPLWVYLCPDGGVVRVKPVGDPNSSYRPQPHASKGLRFPFDSKFDGFADETVKIDNEGNPIPKSRADLLVKDLVDGWADDGHTNLVL